MLECNLIWTNCFCWLSSTIFILKIYLYFHFHLSCLYVKIIYGMLIISTFYKPKASVSSYGFQNAFPMIFSKPFPPLPRGSRPNELH